RLGGAVLRRQCEPERPRRSGREARLGGRRRLHDRVHHERRNDLDEGRERHRLRRRESHRRRGGRRGGGRLGRRGGRGGPGWAVGANGTILVCSAGCDNASAPWRPLGGSGLPASTLNFTGVWSPDPNHVYAVGTSQTGAGAIWACSAKCNSLTNGGANA